ncbi:antibiotic biosynthesis monooxygenase family protein [Halochromatium salexigens]|uniref:Antibiotic biosynthesis monooxygenase n=1 Tax=Halochromatium salexigens TaxID=49447 RepID=A0AAJ0XI61_HALSE|nr:antibiotic biosynthesis monooxygenase [Halochromatium salexigens]MBK5932205.1 antibiotic biosynthesis monooxygenase [Halochromatium salexigens]
MFIAMNRFRINQGFEDAFEAMWRERESQLDAMPGFCGFRLLKGQDDGESRLYASYTQWASRADFDAWRESEAFRQAHAQAKAPQGTYAGHPVFEGFDVVLEEALP